MVCSSVRADSPRTLASGLSLRTGGQTMVNYFSVDLTHSKYFVPKTAFSCKGGVIIYIIHIFLLLFFLVKIFR